MKRGEIWWASLDEPQGSGPGYKRPVVIISSNSFNDSFIKTVIVAVITSNLHLANAPGNLKIPKSKKGLPKDSVINISQLITLDKCYLTEKVGKLSDKQTILLNEGLKLVLDLS